MRAAMYLVVGACAVAIVLIGVARSTKIRELAPHCSADEYIVDQGGRYVCMKGRVIE